MKFDFMKFDFNCGRQVCELWGKPAVKVREEDSAG